METHNTVLKLIVLDYLWIALGFLLFTVATSLLARKLRSRLLVVSAVAFGYCAVAQFVHFALPFVADSTSLSSGGVLVYFVRSWPPIFLLAAFVWVVFSLRATPARAP